MIGDCQGMSYTILKATVANGCGIKGCNFVPGLIFFHQKGWPDDSAAQRGLCCFYAAKGERYPLSGGFFLIDSNIQVYQLHLKGVFVLLPASERIFKLPPYFFWGNNSYFNICHFFSVTQALRAGVVVDDRYLPAPQT